MRESGNKRMFLHLELEKSQNAGHKAVMDCETIMQKMGYGQITLTQSHVTNRVIKNILIVIQLLKLFFVKKNTEMVVEHPIYIHYIYMLCLKYMRKIRKTKLIFIIHDLEILRNLLKSKGAIKKDKIMFEIADIMIAHNTKMKQYLVEEQGIQEDRIVILDVFDYLTKEEERVEKEVKEENTKKKIAIAGNLSREKSSYIYELDKLALSDVKINLYGANFDRKEAMENCEYQGSYDADQLPFILEGDYGLVWDGPELASCAGNTGNYMRYNNPHKVSLYIAAELPVIIWKQAALAEFVIGKQIGIAVESLENIEDEIGKISGEQYAVFKKNLKELSEKVRHGDYLRSALQSIH